MDVDANVLVSALGQEIGALRVELTLARLRLDAAQVELTDLRAVAGPPTEDPCTT